MQVLFAIIFSLARMVGGPCLTYVTLAAGNPLLIKVPWALVNFNLDDYFSKSREAFFSSFPFLLFFRHGFSLLCHFVLLGHGAGSAAG